MIRRLLRPHHPFSAIVRGRVSHGAMNINRCGARRLIWRVMPSRFLGIFEVRASATERTKKNIERRFFEIPILIGRMELRNKAKLDVLAVGKKASLALHADRWSAPLLPDQSSSNHPLSRRPPGHAIAPRAFPTSMVLQIKRRVTLLSCASELAFRRSESVPVGSGSSTLSGVSFDLRYEGTP
jgi:hypothetical protein